jgi:hypothetical protein
MTADQFRKLALSFTGAIESAHMGHPDFRIKGKIFATLGYPDEKHGMVRVTPAQQSRFRKKAPGVFHPCAGAWGQRGATSVHLASAKVALVRAALEASCRNIAGK